MDIEVSRLHDDASQDSYCTIDKETLISTSKFQMPRPGASSRTSQNRMHLYNFIDVAMRYLPTKHLEIEKR